MACCGFPYDHEQTRHQIFFIAANCLADPPTEQELIGHWKTSDKIDLVFTKEHTFTMKSPDLPRAAAGTWVLHPNGKLDMIVTAELNDAMQQKAAPHQITKGQTFTASGRDRIQASSPSESTDVWTRINTP